jgi:hypothetical protein
MEGSLRHKTALGKVVKGIAEKECGRVADVSPAKAARIIKNAFESGGTKYSTFYAVPRRPASSGPSGRTTPSRSVLEDTQ